MTKMNLGEIITWEDAVVLFQMGKRVQWDDGKGWQDVAAFPIGEDYSKDVFRLAPLTETEWRVKLLIKAADVIQIVETHHRLKLGLDDTLMKFVNEFLDNFNNYESEYGYPRGD